jgi:hypothetical protein
MLLSAPNSPAPATTRDKQALIMARARCSAGQAHHAAQRTKQPCTCRQNHRDRETDALLHTKPRATSRAAPLSGGDT